MLIDYLGQSVKACQGYVSGLSEDALDEVIDTSYTPPVPRGRRLLSIVNDAAEHMGQVGYALGVVKKQVTL